MNRSQDQFKREFLIPSENLGEYIFGFFNKKESTQYASTFPRWVKVISMGKCYFLDLQGPDDILTVVPTEQLYDNYLSKIMNVDNCDAYRATERYLDRLLQLKGEAPSALDKTQLFLNILECKYRNMQIGPKTDIILNVERNIPVRLFVSCGEEFRKLEFCPENIAKLAYNNDQNIMKLWCKYNNNILKKESVLAKRGKIRRVRNGVKSNGLIMRRFSDKKGNTEPYYVVLPTLKNLLKAEKIGVFDKWEMEVISIEYGTVSNLNELPTKINTAKRQGAEGYQFKVPSGDVTLKEIAHAILPAVKPGENRKAIVTENTYEVLLTHLNKKHGTLANEDRLTGTEEIVVPVNDNYIEYSKRTREGLIFIGKVKGIQQ
jgi:hypothetical protein